MVLGGIGPTLLLPYALVGGQHNSASSPTFMFGTCLSQQSITVFGIFRESLENEKENGSVLWSKTVVPLPSVKVPVYITVADVLLVGVFVPWDKIVFVGVAHAMV